MQESMIREAQQERVGEEETTEGAEGRSIVDLMGNTTSGGAEDGGDGQNLLTQLRGSNSNAARTGEYWMVFINSPYVAQKLKERTDFFKLLAKMNHEAKTNRQYGIERGVPRGHNKYIIDTINHLVTFDKYFTKEEKQWVTKKTGLKFTRTVFFRRVSYGHAQNTVVIFGPKTKVEVRMHSKNWNNPYKHHKRLGTYRGSLVGFHPKQILDGRAMIYRTLRKMRAKEMEVSAYVNIGLGTLGFIISTIALKKPGGRAFKRAGQVFALDQFMSGVDTLVDLNLHAFNPKKEYKILKGWIVQELGPVGGKIYDISSLVVGLKSAKGSVGDIMTGTQMNELIWAAANIMRQSHNLPKVVENFNKQKTGGRSRGAHKR